MKGDKIMNKQLKTLKFIKNEFFGEVLIFAIITMLSISIIAFILTPEPYNASSPAPAMTAERTESITATETVIPTTEKIQEPQVYDVIPDPEPTLPFTEREAEILAKTVWGEARGLSTEEQRLVIWTVLQRVDDNRWGNTIEAVITAPRQFNGYRERNPVTPEIHALVVQELTDWHNGENPPTHELFAPNAPYFFFDGDGKNNWFREVWR